MATVLKPPDDRPPAPVKLRGKRRIHQTAERVHVAACFPWPEADLALVQPQALVCLGATAAKVLLGPEVRIGRDRGRKMISDLAPHVSITAHPSSILRAQDERETAMDQLVDDPRMVSTWLRAR